MWNKIIKWSLNNRVILIITFLILSIYSIFILENINIDALPSLNAPTVIILTSTPGMAPQEVEKLISYPIETGLTGASNLRRVRSRSTDGLSIVWAEFKWDTDPYLARQIISERLQNVKNQLPLKIKPIITPISSIMGEIMVIGLYGKKDLKTIRDIADWKVVPELLSIPGVSQVTTLGGEKKEIHIELKPEKILQFNLSPSSIAQRLKNSLQNRVGGYIKTDIEEYQIRVIGRVENFNILNKIKVGTIDNKPILVKDIATIKVKSSIKRGDGSINGKPAVLITIQKTPFENTLKLTKKIDKKILELEKNLPKGIKIFKKGFRQERFITRSINNLKNEIIQSSILVIFILLLFLYNFKAALISFLSLPFSLMFSIIILNFLGESINTMSLGGFAIAIGALVDDAIIDVENVERRLKGVKRLNLKEKIDIVFKASSEIRNVIVYATLIVISVFIPLFFLTGFEGKLIKPLGISYIISLLSSLLVAVTITPVLCSILLTPSLKNKKGTFLSIFLKKLYKPILNFSIKHPLLIIIPSILMIFLSISLIFSFKRDFIPKFNEGSFSVATFAPPGTSLEYSSKESLKIEKKISKLPFVKAVTRRTGHGGERDEHAHGVNVSGFDIITKDGIKKNYAEKKIREILESSSLQTVLSQPISFRLAHMNSGTSASIVIKLFGPNILKLKTFANKIKAEMEEIKNLVDINIALQSQITQLKIEPNLNNLPLFNIDQNSLIDFIELITLGLNIGDWWEGRKKYPLLLTYPNREKINKKKIDKIIFTDGNSIIPLNQVIKTDYTLATSQIDHENGKRLITISANVQGGDSFKLVSKIKKSIDKYIKLPQNYHIKYDGDFKNGKKSEKTILKFSILVFIIIITLLYTMFRSIKDSFLIVLNIPMALIGGVLTIYFTGNSLTIASIIGFITLFGISIRNGIMLISHYKYIRDKYNLSIDQTIIKGSLERLNPILMTALATALALIPIVLAYNKPGNELQAPMGGVILGGMISATILNMIIIPSCYKLFNRS